MTASNTLRLFVVVFFLQACTLFDGTTPAPDNNEDAETSESPDGDSSFSQEPESSFNESESISENETSNFSSPIYGELWALTATGTKEATCTITGDKGRLLGSGAPSELAYQTGTEEIARIRCGDKAVLFKVGDQKVELSDKPTFVSQLFPDSVFAEGSPLILEAIMNLDLSTPAGIAVARSLAEYEQVVSELETKRDEPISLENETAYQEACLRTTTLFVKWLIHIGQPVIVDTNAQSQILSQCTIDEAHRLSQDAVAVDAGVIGLSGCLVYHKLYAITDYNNPLFVPDNIPESFRSALDVSKTLSRFFSSCINPHDKVFSLSSIHDFLFNHLGHGGFLEDDEGTLTEKKVLQSDLENFFGTLETLVQKQTTTLDTFKAYRFHTGYNPSGGWEINVAAALQDLPLECVDSTPLTPCLVPPLLFGYDEHGLREEVLGPYLLQLQWRDGGFSEHATLIDLETRRPLRDAFYQPLLVTIDPLLYSPIDFSNPFYLKDLDPIADANGNSAPFSNADWRNAYPTYEKLPNIYLFSNPELTVKLVRVLSSVIHRDELSAMQAFAIYKLITKAMAAMPSADGSHVFLTDHGKTIAKWDELAGNWFAAANQAVQWSTSGRLRTRPSGKVTLDESRCLVHVPNASQNENCTLTSTVILDRNHGELEGEIIRYPVKGSFIFKTDSQKAVFSPSHLLLLPPPRGSTKEHLFFVGDPFLRFSFAGQKTTVKLENGNKIKSSFSAHGVSH